MSVIPYLENIRKLLDKGWTQGAFARDNSQVAVNTRSPKAVCWCYEGALMASLPQYDHSVGGEGTREVWSKLEKLLHEVTGTDYLPNYNDDPKRTKAQVLASVDIAIELAKERGL